MKRLIIAVALTVLSFQCFPVSAQISFTWREFFKQKRTERKYGLQQIAQLQLYLEAVKNGYRLVNNGLTTINRIKNGEFSLHDVFYGDLLRVNAAVAKAPAAVVAISHSRSIYRSSSQFLRQIASEPFLESQQRRFLELSCHNLIRSVDKNMDRLAKILSPNKFQLSDAERFHQLDEILMTSIRHLAFSKYFFNDARIIATGRRSEVVDKGVLEGLYDIKPN